MGSFFQRASAKSFSFASRQLGRLGAWVRARPRLAAWVLPSADEQAQADYQAVNRRCFGSFYEQERMLADRSRMEFYHRAITRHVHAGDRVIDLGTGTGILAGFAARSGAGQVYAIDHSDMLHYAEEIAAHNGIERVTFVAKHSRDFSLGERVDVIVHEQMGDCLFDEAMVPNVVDLRDRLLKPGGRIVPSRFELFCEPAMLRDERVVPFLWEMNVFGYDYGAMARYRPDDPAYYHRSSSDATVVQRFLGEPAPAVRLDLATVRETDLPEEVSFSRIVTEAGRLDALAVFFKAHVDDDLCLSTNPLDAGRAPHWGFRLLRLDREPVQAGDRIDVRLSAGRWQEPDTWRWQVTRQPAGPAPGATPSATPGGAR